MGHTLLSSLKSTVNFQVFDIKGGTMSKVVASKDFKKFVTLDDSGSAYFLKEMESPVLTG